MKDNNLLENALQELMVLSKLLEEKCEEYRLELSGQMKELSSNEMQIRNVENETNNMKDYFSPLSSKKTNIKNGLKLREVEIQDAVNLLEKKIEETEERIISIGKLEKEIQESIALQEEEEKRKQQEKQQEQEKEKFLKSLYVEIEKNEIGQISKGLESARNSLEKKIEFCENIIDQDANRVKLELKSMKHDLEKSEEYIGLLKELMTNNGKVFSIRRQIEKLIEEQQREKRDVAFEIQGNIESIALEIKQLVYVLIKKECHNAFVYMNADKILITARQKGRKVQFVIADDGNAYDEKSLRNDSINEIPLEFKETVTKLQKLCSCKIESEKHVGTTICIEANLD